MAPKNWTVKDLLNIIERRLKASSANNINREQTLEDMQLAWQDIISEGDGVGHEGWFWNIFSHTIVIGLSLQTVPIDPTPSIHRVLGIRMPDRTAGPRSLRQISQRRFDEIVYDQAETASSPQRFMISAFDPVAGTYTVTFHPAYAAAPTTDPVLRYQGEAPELTDSNMVADNIQIPASLREALIWGTLVRSLGDHDRNGKRTTSGQMFDRAMSKMLDHQYASETQGERIYTESETMIEAVQIDARLSDREWSW